MFISAFNTFLFPLILLELSWSTHSARGAAAIVPSGRDRWEEYSSGWPELSAPLCAGNGAAGFILFFAQAGAAGHSRFSLPFDPP